MNLEDLIKFYREQAQDKKPPFFCSDEQLTIYANEAQDEACRRGQLLRQSTGPMCQLAFEPGAEVVPLDSRVVKVLRSMVDGLPVSVITAQDMDQMHPGWEADTVRCRPRVLVSGMTTDALHLWPVPEVAGEIRLTVQRLPMKQMQNSNDKPEIRREAHPALVDWMLYRVFSSEDTEIYNDTKAQLALRRFQGEFGSKASARNETWVRDGVGAMPGPLA